MGLQLDRYSLELMVKAKVSAKIELVNVRQEIAGKVREVDDAW
jgi:hypothetical protein